MKHYYGDLFTSDAPALGHGVNCFGLMGAGIAKTFKERFPENFKAYEAHCESGMLAGSVYVHGYENDKLIANMASQFKPGRFATYEHLLKSAYSAAVFLKRYDVTRCAIPEIGCGIGGLVWHRAATVLEAVELAVTDFEFEVWHYEG